MEKANFEWCFEIGQQVTVDVDGAEDDNLVKVTARKLDEDDTQLYTVERISDGEVWDEVPASLMSEVA